MSEILFFDSKFSDFLSATGPICKISGILSLEPHFFFNEKGNYLKVESNDTLSYIPHNKISLADDKDNSKYRTSLKIGRFINKFFKKEVINSLEIVDSDNEIFVNLFKSYFDADQNNLKIISGPEIHKWYLEDNYLTPNNCRIGTLWNSCMRYKRKNSFMAIYSQNPDQVKMLINTDSDGKLKSRALLWENCEDQSGNKVKVMDRIYSVYDHEVAKFKKWACDNGYIHKKDQSAKNERQFITPDGPCRLSLKVNLENWKFRLYPYIDTFKFLDYKRGFVYNCDNQEHDFVLIQNNGSLFEEESSDDDEQNTEDW